MSKMGKLIIFIGLFFALIVGAVYTSLINNNYFESTSVALLSWIVFNQCVIFLAKEEQK